MCVFCCIIYRVVKVGPVVSCRTLGNIYLAHYFVIITVHKSHEGCRSGGGDVDVVPGVRGDCFQLCLTRFLGGPIGGIC